MPLVELEELRESWATLMPQYDHFSASSMTQFMRCPEQWRQVRCLGKRQRPSGASVWGSADHTTMAMHFAEQVDGKPGLTVAETREAFAVEFDRKVESEGGIGEIEWAREKIGLPGARKIAAQSKDDGVKLVSLYREVLAPSVTPLAVEAEFTLERPQWPVRIIGRTDVVTPTELIERKIVGRTESKPKGDWIVQGRIYRLATGKPTRWHQSIRTKQPNVNADVAAGFEADSSTERLIEQVIRTVGHYLTVYGPDQPWPGAVTHPWSCEYCGFKPSCFWWAT